MVTAGQAVTVHCNLLWILDGEDGLLGGAGGAGIADDVGGLGAAVGTLTVEPPLQHSGQRYCTTHL